MQPSNQPSLKEVTVKTGNVAWINFTIGSAFPVQNILMVTQGVSLIQSCHSSEDFNPVNTLFLHPFIHDALQTESQSCFPEHLDQAIALRPHLPSPLEGLTLPTYVPHVQQPLQLCVRSSDISSSDENNSISSFYRQGNYWLRISHLPRTSESRSSLGLSIIYSSSYYYYYEELVTLT